MSGPHVTSHTDFAPRISVPSNVASVVRLLRARACAVQRSPGGGLVPVEMHYVHAYNR